MAVREHVRNPSAHERDRGGRVRRPLSRISDGPPATRRFSAVGTAGERRGFGVVGGAVLGRGSDGAGTVPHGCR